MTDRKKPRKGDEDAAQSKRFLDLASELEADGDLSPTEAEGAFERLMDRALPSKPRKSP